MTDRKMKMRTRVQNGTIELRVLISHPMEAGLRTDKNTRKKIPPNYIQKVQVELSDKVVAIVNTGTAVSEDPLLGFRLKGAKNGDKLRVFWSDNMGESGSLDGIVDIS